jgi:hypothetical protein
MPIYEVRRLTVEPRISKACSSDYSFEGKFVLLHVARSNLISCGARYSLRCALPYSETSWSFICLIVIDILQAGAGIESGRCVNTLRVVLSVIRGVHLMLKERYF